MKASSNIDSTLGSTPVKSQSLTLNVDTCDGVENKAVSDISISTFVFASVLRSSPKAKPVMRRVMACNEKDARRQLVQQYILSLAARITVSEVSDGRDN